VIPYALATDGDTLWVTSFEDDQIVRVDLATKQVVAKVAVSKPTGVAVGFDGIWVVRHRDDVLVRINPASNKIAAEISLGARGPSDTCGMCVENVIVSGDSVWTANNQGRSVSRIDPRTNKLSATIKLPFRAWTVSAGDGEVWASQFDATLNDTFVDPSTWGVARIDSATGKATSYDVPGTFSVLWAGGVLWIATPTRRGDLLSRFELGAG
jgi:YVTN family beta-propeller protein